MIKKGITFALLAACAIAARGNYKLENDKIRFELDDSGRLVSLKDPATGKDFAGGGALWRIIYQDGLSLEESTDAEKVLAKVEKVSDSQIDVSWGGDFPVKISCVLRGDEIVLTPEIENASKNLVLREFQFPLIKNANVSDGARLVWTRGAGEQIRNVRGYVRGAFTQYVAEDHKAIERSVIYPGTAASNFYVVEDAGTSLYIASLDKTFTKTLQLLRLRDFLKKPEIDFTMVKYPYLNPGESENMREYVLSVHKGDWHYFAKKYSDWAHTWYKQCNVADTVKKSNGWQRIIMRHQYGKIMFKYTQLPEIRKAGKEAGIDTLFMFGWTKEGHDAGYPEYSADDTQGGDAALKKRIEEFQSDGGNVIVYYNGQLIDMNTDYYRTIGKKISVKVSDGTEHIERYMFGGEGTALRTFGNKTFVTACPACPEWLERLEKLVDRAIALGANGVFFDQLGMFSQSCWDASHGHKVPCMDVMRYKREMMRKLRAYVDEKNPGMSFGIEWHSDCTSQYADYIHNCGFSTEIAGRETNGKPYIHALPVYRYMFPELPVSDRLIRDDRDIERRVNIALMWGWFSDVEIYRCRATIDATPTYKAYLTKADALRDKYRALILNGTFRDTDLAKSSSDKVDYTVFTNGGELAVLVTNTWCASETAKITVAGYEFVKSDGLGEFKASGEGDSANVELKKNALALLLFKKAK